MNWDEFWKEARQEAYEHSVELDGIKRDWHGKFAEKEFTINGELLKKLIMLCHPDKHGGSMLANDVMVELLAIREG